MYKKVTASSSSFVKSSNPASLQAEEVIIMKDVINKFMMVKVNTVRPDTNAKLKAWGKKKSQAT